MSTRLDRQNGVAALSIHSATPNPCSFPESGASLDGCAAVRYIHVVFDSACAQIATAQALSTHRGAPGRPVGHDPRAIMKLQSASVAVSESGSGSDGGPHGFLFFPWASRPTTSI